MWILFYLAFNSPIGAMSQFKSKEDCETFRNELSHKIPMKASGCLRFDPAPPMVIEAPHHHDEHGHEGEKDH